MPRDTSLLDLYAGSPFGQYERVEVTFPSTANLDTVIKHGLQTVAPDSVEYLVLKSDRAGSVYHDQSATRKAWGSTFIVLRSSVASQKVTLLLTVPRIST